MIDRMLQKRKLALPVVLIIAVLVILAVSFTPDFSVSAEDVVCEFTVSLSYIGTKLVAEKVNFVFTITNTASVNPDNAIFYYIMDSSAATPSESDFLLTGVQISGNSLSVSATEANCSTKYFHFMSAYDNSGTITYNILPTAYDVTFFLPVFTLNPVFAGTEDNYVSSAITKDDVHVRAVLDPEVTTYMTANGYADAVIKYYLSDSAKTKEQLVALAESAWFAAQTDVSGNVFYSTESAPDKFLKYVYFKVTAGSSVQKTTSYQTTVFKINLNRLPSFIVAAEDGYAGTYINDDVAFSLGLKDADYAVEDVDFYSYESSALISDPTTILNENWDVITPSAGIVKWELLQSTVAASADLFYNKYVYFRAVSKTDNTLIYYASKGERVRIDTRTPEFQAFDISQYNEGTSSIVVNSYNGVALELNKSGNYVPYTGAWCSTKNASLYIDILASSFDGDRLTYLYSTDGGLTFTYLSNATTVDVTAGGQTVSAQRFALPFESLDTTEFQIKAVSGNNIATVYTDGLIDAKNYTVKFDTITPSFSINPSVAGNLVNGSVYYYSLPTLTVSSLATNVSGVTYFYYDSLLDVAAQPDESSPDWVPYSPEGVSYGAQTGAGTKYQFFCAKSGANASYYAYMTFNYDTQLPVLSMSYASEGAITAATSTKTVEEKERTVYTLDRAANNGLFITFQNSLLSSTAPASYYYKDLNNPTADYVLIGTDNGISPVVLTIATKGTYNYLIRIQSGALAIDKTDTNLEDYVYSEVELNFVVCEKNYFFDVETDYANEWTNEDINFDFVFDDDGFSYSVWQSTVTGGIAVEEELTVYQIDGNYDLVLHEGDAGYDSYVYQPFEDSRLRFRYTVSVPDYIEGVTAVTECQINSKAVTYFAKNMANTPKNCLVEEEGVQTDKGAFNLKVDKIIPNIEFVTLFNGEEEAYDFDNGGTVWYADELFVLLKNTMQTIAPLSASMTVGAYSADLSLYSEAEFEDHNFSVGSDTYYYYKISTSMDNARMEFSITSEAGNEISRDFYARIDMTVPYFKLIDGKTLAEYTDEYSELLSWVGNQLGDGSEGYPIYMISTTAGYASENYTYTFRQESGGTTYNAVSTEDGMLASVYVYDISTKAAGTANFIFTVTNTAKTPVGVLPKSATITLKINYDFGDFEDDGTVEPFTLGDVEIYDVINDVNTTIGTYTASDTFFSNEKLRVKLACNKSNNNNVGSGVYYQFKIGGSAEDSEDWIDIANQDFSSPYHIDYAGYFYISSDQFPTAYDSNLHFRAISGAGKTSAAESVLIRNDQILPEPVFDYENGAYSSSDIVLTPENGKDNKAPVYYQYIIGGTGETPVWGDTWIEMNNATGTGYTATSESVTISQSGLWISFRARVEVDGSSRVTADTAANGVIFRALIDRSLAHFYNVQIGEANSSDIDYGEWLSDIRFQFNQSGSGHLFRLSGYATDILSGEETTSKLNYWYRIGDYTDPDEGWVLISTWYRYDPNNLEAPWSTYTQEDMETKSGTQYLVYYFKVDWTANGNLWFKVTTEAGEGEMWSKYYSVQTDVDAPDFVLSAYTVAENGAKEDYIEGTWKTSYVQMVIDQKSVGAAEYAFSLDAVDALGSVHYETATWISFASREFSTEMLTESGYKGTETITIRATSTINGKITYKQFKAYRDNLNPIPTIGTFDSGLESGSWSKNNIVRFAVFNSSNNLSNVTYSWYIYYGTSLIGENQGYLDSRFPIAENAITYIDPLTGKKIISQVVRSKAFNLTYDGTTTKYTVVVNAVSEAGLTGSTSFVVNIDINAPVISVTGMESGDTCYVDRYIQYFDDNNNQNIKKATINGYDIVSGTWVNRKSHPVNSENEFVIVIIDYAGNTTTFRFTMLEFPAKVYTVKISQKDLVDALEAEVRAVILDRPDLSSNRQSYFEDLIYSLNIRIDYLKRQTEVFISNVDPLPVSLDEVTLGAHYFLAKELLDEWEQLTDEQQSMERVVTAYGKLRNIYEYLLDEREVVDAVELSTYNLPSRNFVKLSDKTQVVGVQSAYNALTQDQKVVFDSYLYNKINALLEIIDSYNLIVDFSDASGDNLYSVKVESSVASSVILNAVEVPDNSEQFKTAQNKVIENLGNYKIIQMFNMSYIRDDISVVPTSAMVITLPLSKEILARDDYKIIHVLANGDVEIIQSYTLNPDGVTVSFNATSLNGYAIAVKATVSTSTTEVVSTGSNAGLVVDPEMLLYVGGGVAILVVLLLIVLLITALVRRKSIEGKYAVKRYNKKLLKEQKVLMLKKYNAEAEIEKKEKAIAASEKKEKTAEGKSKKEPTPKKEEKKEKSKPSKDKKKK